MRPLSVLIAAMLSTMTGQERIPDPFLSLPLASNTKPTKTEGWHYSKEERNIHGYDTHYAHDFAVPRGTPVLAPCDGWAIASYHLFITDRKYQKKEVGFGLGKFVQIITADNTYVVCAHLETIDKRLHTHAPEKRQNGWYPQVVHTFHRELLKDRNAALAKFKALEIKRGVPIGIAGDTGCTWGYDETSTHRPDPKRFPSWDEVHVHLEVFLRNAKGSKSKRIDPYGVRGAWPGHNLWRKTAQQRITFADE